MWITAIPGEGHCLALQCSIFLVVARSMQVIPTMHTTEMSTAQMITQLEAEKLARKRRGRDMFKKVVF